MTTIRNISHLFDLFFLLFSLHPKSGFLAPYKKQVHLCQIIQYSVVLLLSIHYFLSAPVSVSFSQSSLVCKVVLDSSLELLSFFYLLT